MKGIIHILVLAGLGPSFSACKEDFDETPLPAYTIELLFPHQGEMVDSCCFSFLWQSSAPTSDFRLTVGEDENFQTFMLDTFVDAMSFTFTPILKSGTTYYWKISSMLLQTEAKDSFRTKENPVPKLKLLFPVSNEQVDFCCFGFAWESTVTTSDFQLLLSEDEKFTEIILDTTTELLHYFYVQHLIPGRKYFWKIGSNLLQEEVVDSFFVKDYLAYYQGTYPVNVVIQEWNFQDGVTWDSTFMGNVIIERITEEKVRVLETTTGKGRLYTYNAYLSSEHHVSFLYDDASRSSVFGFNIFDDTFGGQIIEGGVGSRTIYSFSGKKE